MRHGATAPRRYGHAAARVDPQGVLQILRDPSSIAIAFLLPVVLLLIFGYGVSLDAEHVPDRRWSWSSPAPTPPDFTGGFQQSRYFEPVSCATCARRSRRCMTRQVTAIVHLRADFARHLRQPDGAPIQVDRQRRGRQQRALILGYVQGVWQKWLAAAGAAAQGEALSMPVQLEQRVWFNSELRSRNFLVPGLIAIIMTLIGALLTALVMAREWERGTMEALLVTPVDDARGAAGQAGALLRPGHGRHGAVRGHGGLAVRRAVARLALAAVRPRRRCSCWRRWAWACSSRRVAKNQFVAGQVAIIATFLPAFILSGFIFDIGSMPPVVQGITQSCAARYFVAIAANGVPGGQRVVGDLAQRAGAGW